MGKPPSEMAPAPSPIGPVAGVVVGVITVRIVAWLAGGIAIWLGFLIVVTVVAVTTFLSIVLRRR